MRNIALITAFVLAAGITTYFGKIRERYDIPADIGYQLVEEDNDIESYDNPILCKTEKEIQEALKNAKAGDVILVRKGYYTDCNYSIDCEGAKDNYITIKNYPNERVVFKNSRFTFKENCRYIKFGGFYIKEFTGKSNFDYCMKISGGCQNIEIENIEMASIVCKKPKKMGINPFVVYGDAEKSISDITISNCYIHDCTTGYCEALTINGNVKNCTITNCTINNTGNIGIDIAGNYDHTKASEDIYNQARKITVSNCLIKSCNSPNAMSAGLYCDGSRNVTFCNNYIIDSQCGIALGAEEAGDDVYDFDIYDNVVINCKVPLEAGAYLDTGAEHYDTKVHDNKFICQKRSNFNTKYIVVLTNTSGFKFYDNEIIAEDDKIGMYYTNKNNSNIKIYDNTWNGEEKE
ncbi:MAG: right-handed parallel beta-helix repeat-containing protein [Lachnospiraceae bacterium]|nr:right-handed parallel beta-helix repeat-containing protein [Lachnospiraceae bacterium]